MKCSSKGCKKKGKVYGFLAKGTIAQTPLCYCLNHLSILLNLSQLFRSVYDVKKNKIVKNTLETGSAQIFREVFKDHLALQIKKGRTKKILEDLKNNPSHWFLKS